ncbi:MAG: zf-TFIIB domain-containing protein [Thermoproteota archaeon]|nr:zf-TFIIB domain-containing protein [Thermoproteota archaeon]
MKCPNCFSEMVLTSRFCVELDKCPECEGIWLDCGEIEKITDNNKIGNELHERNQVEKNHDCDGQDKGYYFYKKDYREDASRDEMFDFE